MGSLNSAAVSEVGSLFHGQKAVLRIFFEIDIYFIYSFYELRVRPDHYYHVTELWQQQDP